MISTEVTISLYNKSFVDDVKHLVGIDILVPVYILEYENNYELQFKSDYEEWELDIRFSSTFSDYEFIGSATHNKEDVILSIHRFQSPLCTDGWGRPLENPLNQTKYLVKRNSFRKEVFVKVNPEITVLFKGIERSYYINMINGINTETKEKGILLLDEFKIRIEKQQGNILKDRLYPSVLEAFYGGYYKLQRLVEQDFEKFVEQEKREVREQRKLPRKIVRDFITACNESNHTRMSINLHDDIALDVFLDRSIKASLSGKIKVENFLLTQRSHLCNRGMSIRSRWFFQSSTIEIGLKYSNDEDCNRHKGDWLMQSMAFTIYNDRIVRIRMEGRQF